MALESAQNRAERVVRRLISTLFKIKNCILIKTDKDILSMSVFLILQRLTISNTSFGEKETINIYIIFLIMLSYVVGISTYLFSLENIYGQSIGSDLSFVIVFSLLAYILICCPLYYTVIALIDKWFDTFKSILYPIGCMLIFFIPTFVIFLFWGGTSPFSPEAGLFYLFYVATGLVFGLGYWLIKTATLKQKFN